jgi:hypothetical protein
MNQKQAHRLRRLVKKTTPPNHPLGFDHERYNNLKRDWNNTPRNERGKLMNMLELAAENIAATMEPQSA